MVELQLFTVNISLTFPNLYSNYYFSIITKIPFWKNTVKKYYSQNWKTNSKLCILYASMPFTKGIYKKQWGIDRHPFRKWSTMKNRHKCTIHKGKSLLTFLRLQGEGCSPPLKEKYSAQKCIAIFPSITLTNMENSSNVWGCWEDHLITWKNVYHMRNKNTMLPNDVLSLKKFQWLCIETTLLVENKPNVNSTYVWVVGLYMISVFLMILL